MDQLFALRNIYSGAQILAAVELIARQFALRRPNFVGMASLSGRPAAAAAWLTMSTILTGLVKAAGFENVSIVGHSTCGMVSQTYAGVFPEKVSRLVVLDGVTNYPAR